VAPLRLGGRRGKQSTPRVWLGGTGERSTVGKQELGGARGRPFEDEPKGNGMFSQTDKLECTGLYDVILREIEKVFWMKFI
jgi:hypothetical protein